MTKSTKNNTSDRIQTIASVAALAALALVLGYIEALIPLPVSIPGLKLGLANIVVLVAMYVFGPKISFMIMLLKVFLMVFIIGTPSILPFSLSGSLFAWLIIFCFYRFSWMSIILLSVLSALGHNIAQLFAASIILSNAAVFLNLPFMLVGACVAGCAIGVISMGVIKSLKHYLKLN